MAVLIIVIMLRKNIRPSAMKKSINLKHMHNTLKSFPVFLIGNGPSVNDENVSDLKDYFTIGLNRAFMALDPTILFWQDSHLWLTEKAGILESKSIKICRDISDPQNRFNHFRLRTTDNFRLPDGPQLLYGKGATGPLAFQFAYALGCDPIVLIGFDCKYRNGKTDFYGINKNHKAYTLNNCTRGLQWMANLRTERKIINCSDNDVFSNRVTLKNTLAKMKQFARGQEFYNKTIMKNVH